MYLVISDDLEWCQEELATLDKNVVINEDYGTTFEDMAILTLGAHTITSVGSFGTWGATLGLGELIFPAKQISKQPYHMHNELRRVKHPKIKGIFWD